MKAGIKVGPRDWQQVLLKVKPECLEVWFRLDWKKKYTPMFNYLNKNKIPYGLHFWAMIDGKYFPDMLSLDKDIAKKTFTLIKKTIDIASLHKATYINFHPESYRTNLLDLERSTIKTLNPKQKLNKEKSFNQLLTYLEKIRRYAKKRNIIPFIETVPKFMPSDFKNIKKGRLKAQKSEGMETEKFISLSKLKYPICLDIGHTLGQFITNDKDKLFNYLYNSAKKMLTSIGLMHITTNRPPFNGTDSHNGILEKDFKQGVVPNKKQLIKLLTLFKDTNTWLIPEPHENMIENHLELTKILKQIKNK
ncbi:TIM barrel protein [Patescibacteria group bacterium]